MDHVIENVVESGVRWDGDHVAPYGDIHSDVVVVEDYNHIAGIRWIAPNCSRYGLRKLGRCQQVAVWPVKAYFFASEAVSRARRACISENQRTVLNARKCH